MVVFFILAVGLLNAAETPQSVLAKFDSLYHDYLKGDLSTARKSLETTLMLVEKSKLDPRPKAHCLFFTYARLFALERDIGAPELAECYLIKARYWYLEKRLIDGQSLQEAGAFLRAFDANRCADFVSDWDKNHNDGQPPRFHSGVSKKDTAIP